MNLQKLKKASLNELRVRAGQRLAAFKERRGWSALVKLPAGDAFASLINRHGCDPYALLEYFRLRSEPKFFVSFKSPEKTVTEFKFRWPRTVERLIDKADRICEEKFDLLGFTNLSFGKPIDWHFEPVTGKRIPLLHWSKLNFLDADIAGDKKIIWELNRHQYFITLGQAYWLTGDERYARVFAEHLNAWMDANPPKLGINWASSLEVAFRSIAWLWAFYFFKSSPSLSNETFTRAWKFLYLSARHLESYLSTYFSPNTHLTGEALGLFYLGTFLPEFKESKRWSNTGLKILVQQASRHVKADGVYFEQSSYYHRYAADFYLHLAILLQVNGKKVPIEIEKSLIGLLDHLMYLTRPDGSTPLFGDDDGGRLVMLTLEKSNDFRGTLATAAAFFKRADYKYVAVDGAEEALWLVGPDSLRELDLLESREPVSQSMAFEHGGYYIMRDGWDRSANYLRFDAGPHGTLNCGHAHADALSFDLAALGRTLLVDPGTYTYTGSKEMRDWFRSSAAHNTLTVDGQSSSIPDGPFSWKHIAQSTSLQWISRAQFDFFAGNHDGYERLASPATHFREILFLKGKYWIIRDRIDTAGPHRYDLYFHFTGDACPSIDTEGRAVQEVAGNLPGLQVFTFGVEGQWRKEQGWMSPVYGKRGAAPVCTFTAEAKGPQEFITFMIPQAAGKDQAIVRVVDSVKGKAFEIEDPYTRDVLILGQGQQIEAAGLGSDFQLAWVRFRLGSSSLEELVLIAGRHLMVNGQEIIDASQFINYLAGRRVENEIRCETDINVDLRLPIKFGEPVTSNSVHESVS